MLRRRQKDGPFVTMTAGNFPEDGKTAPSLWSQEHIGIVNSREGIGGQFILPVSLVHFIHVIIAPLRRGRRRSSRQAPSRFQAGSPTNVRRREPQRGADVGVIERQRLSL